MSDIAPQTPPPATPLVVSANDIPKDAKTIALIAHLLGIIVGFWGALIIWLLKKDDHPFINEQAKEALNFQITVVIASFVSGLLCLVLIGLPLLFAVIVGNLVFSIIAALKANDGVHYRYPFAIRLIK